MANPGCHYVIEEGKFPTEKLANWYHFLVTSYKFDIKDNIEVHFQMTFTKTRPVPWYDALTNRLVKWLQNEFISTSTHFLSILIWNFHLIVKNTYISKLCLYQNNYFQLMADRAFLRES